jgi:hypothetical protein
LTDPSALVAVPAGGDADLVGGDLVDEAVFVGDPARPVSLKAVFERLGLSSGVWCYCQRIPI